MDGWKIVSFWDGFLAGAMLVSGSVLIKDVFLEVEQSKISSTAMGCEKTLSSSMPWFSFFNNHAPRSQADYEKPNSLLWNGWWNAPLLLNKAVFMENYHSKNRPQNTFPV